MGVGDHLDLLRHGVEDEDGVGNDEELIPGVDHGRLVGGKPLEMADHVVAEIAHRAAEKAGKSRELNRGEPGQEVPDKGQRVIGLIRSGSVAVGQELDGVPLERMMIAGVEPRKV